MGNSDADKKQRRILFNKFDKNISNQLSMNEVLKLVCEVLGDMLDEIKESKVKRVVQLAYFKTKRENLKSPYDGFYSESKQVEYFEFRKLLTFIRK